MHVHVIEGDKGGKLIFEHFSAKPIFTQKLESPGFQIKHLDKPILIHHMQVLLPFQMPSPSDLQSKYCKCIFTNDCVKDRNKC